MRTVRNVAFSQRHCVRGRSFKPADAIDDRELETPRVSQARSRTSSNCRIAHSCPAAKCRVCEYAPVSTAIEICASVETRHFRSSPGATLWRLPQCTREAAAVESDQPG